jgi:hypothetical protein
MNEIWTNRPQASRRKALCKIIVDGEDVTSRVEPAFVVDRRHRQAPR